jgi:proton-translocating NADH-quinone oxidoreductase chain N
MPVLGKISSKLRNIMALSASIAPFALTLLMINELSSNATISFSLSGVNGIDLSLAADRLACFMAAVSSSISAVIVLFSFNYIDHYENQNEYYMMVLLFLGSMMGICFSSNLVLLYIFWEITGLSSWRLIGFFRKPNDVVKADKAFLVTMFGALVMLTGFIIVYFETGSFDLSVVRAATGEKPLSLLAAALIMAGILAKSATLPLHTWLPDAGVAPSPVTALLHAAVLVKIGVYAYARLFISTFSVDPSWNTAVIILALASTLVSAGAALRETDLKRIIAYSTISQIGFIFLGLASGSSIGIAGGLLYILMHGFAKAGLFLSAGIIEQRTHERDIRKLGGLFKVMPLTAISFFICAFSVMGIPPFGGFFSKFLVITGAVKSGNAWAAAAFVASGFLTIVYLFRLIREVFIKEPESSDILVKEGSPLMVASVMILAVMSIASGFLVYYPSEYLSLTVQQMLGL